MSEYDVEVLPVFATTMLHVVPPLADLSILYPVMIDPPLSVGVVQLRLICEEDTAVAVSPVGVEGATARVVAEAVFEGGLVPAELIVDTL